MPPPITTVLLQKAMIRLVTPAAHAAMADCYTAPAPASPPAAAEATSRAHGDEAEEI
jgi:hypothetical protein